MSFFFFHIHSIRKKWHGPQRPGGGGLERTIKALMFLPQRTYKLYILLFSLNVRNDSQTEKKYTEKDQFAFTR